MNVWFWAINKRVGRSGDVLNDVAGDMLSLGDTGRRWVHICMQRGRWQWQALLWEVEDHQLSAPRSESTACRSPYKRLITLPLAVHAANNMTWSSQSLHMAFKREHIAIFCCRLHRSILQKLLGTRAQFHPSICQPLILVKQNMHNFP